MINWSHVSMLAKRLAADDPPHVPSWDVALQRGEKSFLDAVGSYARFYGTTVEYSTSSGFFLGSPAFVLAGLGANALLNHSRRTAAQRDAMAQWREVQQSRILVTDQRLLCFIFGGQSRSFFYEAISRIQPDIRNQRLLLEFHDTEPLLVEGIPAAYAAIAALWWVNGPEAVRHHPQVAPLLTFEPGGPMLR